jgi:hypothetical protein
MKDITLEYAKRIGNDVGWMTQLLERGNASMLKSANPKYTQLMHSLNNQAIRASYKMQIVYLVNLIESFIQDYIGFKDDLTESEMNKKGFWEQYLRAVKRNWDTYCKSKNEAINNSTSFMNIRFSLFILKDKYNLDFPSYLTPAIPELGSLRNCLVHYDGDLTRMDKGGNVFRATLIETLKLLELNGNENRLEHLNINNFIDKVTFDLQTFIDLCGGRINRP